MLSRFNDPRNMITKRLIQKLSRQLNILFFSCEISKHHAIYFHELEGDWIVQLDHCLGYFAGMGYTFVPGAVAHSKHIEISFDDNYESWHAALPLLEKYKAQARFYTNTCVFQEDGECEALISYRRAIGYSGSDRPLSRSQLRDISSSGHIIGAHTHTHANLASLSASEVREEMIVNKQILEDITGKIVNEMAFTYGMPRNFSPEAEMVCREIGFSRIAHATPGMQYAKIDEGLVHRTGWKKEISLEENIENICIDGRLFVSLTGRSPLG
jgi:peptidoglycan/xylan/chitin deacetylase (PgdA/CDA1 family)